MRRPHPDPLAELRRAVGRLERSKGKRIARRNARRAFLRAVNLAKRYYLDAHPCIDEAGQEIVRKKERGLRCPACNVPMGSVKVFCEHWIRAHDRHPSVTCACGKSFGPRESRHFVKQFCCHVRGLKDITAHFTLGALASIGGSNGKAV